MNLRGRRIVTVSNSNSISDIDSTVSKIKSDEHDRNGTTSWTNRTLANGKATGGLIFKPYFSNYKLQIKQSKLLNTRGLFAFSHIKAGTIICRATGTFSDFIPQNRFCYHVRKDPFRVLKLDDPTIEYPGNIINTANKKGDNNAVFRHHPSKTFITVTATKTIHKSDEILIPYGTKLTKSIRNYAINNPPIQSSPKIILNPKIINPKKIVVCPKCNGKIQIFKLKRHINNFKCRNTILQTFNLKCN